MVDFSELVVCFGVFVFLLDLCEQVTCVEVDRNLCALLEAEYGDRPGFTLREADLARLDWAEIIEAAGPRPVIAGNLPYVLTSTVLFALANRQADLAGGVFMVQKEVAERLTAVPGGRDFGVLAVVLGSLFEISLRRTVPGTVFWPQPEVASAIICLLPREPWDPTELTHFIATVKLFFQQRRKQMGSLLRRQLKIDEPAVAAMAQAVGFAPAQRPEPLVAA